MIYLLPHSIDHAADSAPDRAAFRCDDQSLTYQQLVEVTNRLAHALIDQGIKPGDRVGVLMPRCVQSAVAVYGIMKAGAAYVPLDPHSPPASLQILIDYCGIRCVVTSGMKSGLLEMLVADSEKLEAVIGSTQLDSSCRWIPWEDVDEFPANAPRAINILEQDLAYIMFTSGSTGRPKGIMHTHYSGLSYARLSVDTYGIQGSDIIGSHSPLYFDMSTLGYFSGPLAAATTILIPEAHTRLPASLSQLIETEQMTIWYSVPYALIQLHMRGVLESRDFGALRWVLFGGEPFPSKHLRELMQRWPHARFSNVYGPAEVNQCTYYHLPPIDQSELSDSLPIPIGSTWANTSSLVVDENDQPVVAGDLGELLIRSPTMMRGYWGREDLNAAAFFRQTGRSGIEEVFYRTGDLVNVEADDHYVFIGRKDRQVKIRGYRVELDSVEQALSSHPAVEEAGAFTVRDAAEVLHVRASLTLKPQSPSTTSEIEPKELIAYVARRLPWYAVPGEIRVERVLPRTTSGKIDRRQLAVDHSTE